jgi:hypothetical protein
VAIGSRTARWNFLQTPVRPNPKPQKDCASKNTALNVLEGLVCCSVLPFQKSQ